MVIGYSLFEAIPKISYSNFENITKTNLHTLNQKVPCKVTYPVGRHSVNKTLSSCKELLGSKN